MPDGFWVSLVVQVAIAAGTIGACIVGVFGASLKARFLPPQLKLALDQDGGSPSPVLITAPDGSSRTERSRWYHVRVTNERRISPVSSVQVYLLSIAIKDAAGEFKIKWVGEMPLRWQHQEVHSPRRSIGPTGCIDLCSVIKGKWVELHPFVELFALERIYRDVCDLVVTVQARGLEADSAPLRLRIAWNGQWSDDEATMKSHMVVQEYRA